MSSYRGRGGRAGAGRGAAQPKGLFLNGVWHCDCNPRLPAVHFETKKPGPNKGKWFRSCQKAQDDETRCKFFLWDNDAEPREAAALQSNSRTEPGRANPPTPSRPPPRQAPSPPPPYTIDAGPSGASRKRSRTASEEENDEFGIENGDAGFDDELNQVMTAVETPRKTARTDAYATTTPSRRKLPWQKDAPVANTGLGLQTPQTGPRTSTDLFPTRFAAPGSSFLTPSKYKDPPQESRQTATPSSSPLDTPTPSRFKDVGTANGGDDLTEEVLGLLHEANVPLSSQTEQQLKRKLANHTRITKGLKSGRDVLRATVDARNARIEELIYRVSTLEAELEAERLMVKHLQLEAGEGDA